MSRLSLILTFMLLTGTLCAVEAETRWRNMSYDTVAGRQVRFANGSYVNYHRDGRLEGVYPDGRPYRGTWEIGPTNIFAGNPQSISIKLDNGRTNNVYYLQQGENIFVVRRGPGGRDIRAKVLSIKPL